MTDAAKTDPSRLAELRAKIDAIDESVHRLLMQRATVIDELIEVKGTARNGAAFRPGREADMMRRLAARHEGHLPLSAVEHLWREIIATFTALQAPFDVTVSLGAGAVEAVEAARYSFGFSVPLILAETADEVVKRIEEGGDRLGLVLLAEAASAWWTRMDHAHIVARIPFIGMPERQANAPGLVLAPPLADPVPFEVECFSVVAPRLAPVEGVEVLASADGPEGRCHLVASTEGRALMEKAAPDRLDIRPVGGYAKPMRAAPSRA
ncbi:chorismate mutase [Consotaella salsifontis]|uniref:chorismate mutase n=1 Tax=Consotaella salsifontis TaxID=1365950 RepID=A0A1T4RR11_9HYPH|nr:chorismate mutase [Consotaella salsifontis]SKA18429.1 chorismate mutase [Consotaella salsifontis]